MAETLTESIVVTVQNGCCEGHFPGYPLVPAAAQVQWALAALESHTGKRQADGFRWELRQGKFLRELRPGCTVDLQLHPDKRGWRAQVIDADGDYADMLWVVHE